MNIVTCRCQMTPIILFSQVIGLFYFRVHRTALANLSLHLRTDSKSTLPLQYKKRVWSFRFNSTILVVFIIHFTPPSIRHSITNTIWKVTPYGGNAMSPIKLKYCSINFKINDPFMGLYTGFIFFFAPFHPFSHYHARTQVNSLLSLSPSEINLYTFTRYVQDGFKIFPFFNALPNSAY